MLLVSSSPPLASSCLPLPWHEASFSSTLLHPAIAEEELVSGPLADSMGAGLSEEAAVEVAARPWLLVEADHGDGSTLAGRSIVMLVAAGEFYRWEVELVVKAQ